MVRRHHQYQTPPKNHPTVQSYFVGIGGRLFKIGAFSCSPKVHLFYLTNSSQSPIFINKVEQQAQAQKAVMMDRQVEETG
jgi:hypothetical protein